MHQFQKTRNHHHILPWSFPRQIICFVSCVILWHARSHHLLPNHLFHLVCFRWLTIESTREDIYSLKTIELQDFELLNIIIIFNLSIIVRVISLGKKENCNHKNLLTASNCSFLLATTSNDRPAGSEVGRARKALVGVRNINFFL